MTLFDEKTNSSSKPLTQKSHFNVYVTHMIDRGLILVLYKFILQTDEKHHVMQ